MIQKVIEKIKKYLQLDVESKKKRLTQEEKMLIFKVHCFFEMTMRLDSTGFKPPWQIHPVNAFFKEEEITQIWQMEPRLPYPEKAFITKTLNIKLVKNLESLGNL